MPLEVAEALVMVDVDIEPPDSDAVVPTAGKVSDDDSVTGEAIEDVASLAVVTVLSDAEIYEPNGTVAAGGPGATMELVSAAVGMLEMTMELVSVAVVDKVAVAVGHVEQTATVAVIAKVEVAVVVGTAGIAGEVAEASVLLDVKQ